jgi:hypothetical protein
MLTGCHRGVHIPKSFGILCFETTNLVVFAKVTITATWFLHRRWRSIGRKRTAIAAVFCSKPGALALAVFGATSAVQSLGDIAIVITH